MWCVPSSPPPLLPSSSLYSHFTSNGSRQYCPFSAFGNAASIDVYLCLLQASTSMCAATLYELILARPSTESTAMKIPLLRLINLIKCDKANESRISTQQKELVPPTAMTMVPPLSSAKQQNNNNNNRNSIVILHTHTHSHRHTTQRDFPCIRILILNSNWSCAMLTELVRLMLFWIVIYLLFLFFIAPSLLRFSILPRATRMC